MRDYNKWATEKKDAAKKLGHTITYIGKGMSDQYKCSCGWESRSFWDGVEYAFKQWVEEHANQIIESGQQRLDIK